MSIEGTIVGKLAKKSFAKKFQKHSLDQIIFEKNKDDSSIEAV